MAKASVTTIKMPTKYFALISEREGNHHDFLIPEQNSECNQNGKDTAGSADRRRGTDFPRCGVGKRHRRQRRPKHADGNNSMNRRFPIAFSMAAPNIHNPSMFPNQCQNS
jgi:hypothetical protein